MCGSQTGKADTDVALAHWIRNQNTAQFRSVNALQADRRWCLTGTPIQNRLEDLGALIRFLKVPPFDGKSSKAEFKGRIIDPLFSDDDDPCQSLRALLQSTTLRRALPHQSELNVCYKLITLAFSSSERLQYSSILVQERSDMDLIVSTEFTSQKYTRLFALILRLRIFCNIGDNGRESTFRRSYPETLQARLPAESDIGSELGCDVCQNYEIIDLLKDRCFCPSCSRLLQTPMSDSIASTPMPNHIASLPESPLEMEIDLPQTSYGETPQIAVQPPNGIQEHLLEDQTPLEFRESTDIVHSTKLLAVMENLR